MFVQEWGEDRRVLEVRVWTRTANYQELQDHLPGVLGMILEGLRPQG